MEGSKNRGPIPAHLRVFEWYAQHQAWLRDNGHWHHDPGDAAAVRGGSYSGESLRGADLRLAQLDYLNWTDTTFNGADLRGASFGGIDAYGWDFCGADMRGCTITEAIVRRSYFEGTDLRGAYLFGVDCLESRFTGADMRGILIDSADFDEKALEQADLRGAGLDDLKWHIEGA